MPHPDRAAPGTEYRRRVVVALKAFQHFDFLFYAEGALGQDIGGEG